MQQCGCFFITDQQWQTVPQVALFAHATVMSTISRTVLRQSFVNPLKNAPIDQVRYRFPLYDGMSVVGFKCHIGNSTTYRLVKEKEQARADYKEALSRGMTSGLLEQSHEASDVFVTDLGNLPANETVVVEITYLGELKHDAEIDAVRYTIPTAIAPRSGNKPRSIFGFLPSKSGAAGSGIQITVDVTVDDGAYIRNVQSPSHPVRVTLGRTSGMDEKTANTHSAYANLALRKAALEKDFVLLISSKNQGVPRALLEHHPKYPNQRALMTTLVPSFNLPTIQPEIVFVADRSGSMANKMGAVISALHVFLKSLPLGIKFNICSFGSTHSFLWERSKSYDENSLLEALNHVINFDASLDGTEMYEPVKDTVERRDKDMKLEVIILTDGRIWNQQELFDFINNSVSKESARFFSLGIGYAASHSLIEGIARAGNGFAQTAGESDKLESKVIRMLKAALVPHITDYALEVKYENADNECELVEKVTESLSVMAVESNKENENTRSTPISLNDSSAKESYDEGTKKSPAGKYDHLPHVAPPKLLQVPQDIPPLYPFIRTSVYVLMSPDSEYAKKIPRSVVLRGTSPKGPLQLEIRVEDIGKGTTIHQLAAKKAVVELEEGRGWLVDAKDSNGKHLKERYDGQWGDLVEREAVRLGARYQVSGKWCSLVAVEKKQASSEGKMTGKGMVDQDFDMVDWHGVPVQQISAEVSGPSPSREIEKCFGLMDDDTAAAAPPPGPPRVIMNAIIYPSLSMTTPAPARKKRTPLDEIHERFSRLKGASSQATGFKGFKDDYERMHRVIFLQSFDGFWGWHPALFSALGVSEAYVACYMNVEHRFGKDLNVKATLAAVVFFEVRLKDDKDVWELVVEKAKTWLQGQVTASRRGLGKSWEVHRMVRLATDALVRIDGNMVIFGGGD